MSAVADFELLQKLYSLPDDRTVWNLFDTLEPAACSHILAKWRGGAFETGHWLLPALADMQWFGKWFLSERNVKPLVCINSNNNLHSNLALNGEASLWMTEFRGKVSATVVYDGVPMFGHLRRINESTLLGVVDGKTLMGQDIVQKGRHQFFYLERLVDWPKQFVD